MGFATRPQGLRLLALTAILGVSTAHAADPARDAKKQAKTEAKSAVDQTVKTRAATARADIKKTLGFVPNFMEITPDPAIPGAWSEFKGFQMNPDTALSPSTKELVGLAVAAQVPCDYCVYAHTKFAKAHGSTEREVGEAVALAANARRWSTVLNGIQTDEPKFRQEVAGWVEHVKKAAAQPPAKEAGAKEQELADAAAARKDAQQSFGTLPEFIRRYPDQAVAGAWMEYRDVDMSPDTVLPAKEKSLISLAVSSQIPCRYCIIVDTEFAKLNGATEQEINEAIAMAGITRHWSAMLNGLQASEAQFEKDVDRIVKGMAKPAGPRRASLK